MTDLAYTIKQYRAGQGKKEPTGGKDGKPSSPSGNERREKAAGKENGIRKEHTLNSVGPSP